MNSRWVLITGATTGIGYELSKLFAAGKWNLLLNARNEEMLMKRKQELKETYGVEVKTIALDLSERNAPYQIREFVQQEKLNVQALVNNAGFGMVGDFAETDLKTELKMIDLNVSALTALCKLFIPELKKSGSGRIMNVASTAAYLPGPRMTVYYASKAYA
ncbi:MAG: SDR family NAD(P)-dependent oxidoreductase, partial [Calditrichia bacterium]